MRSCCELFNIASCFDRIHLTGNQLLISTGFLIVSSLTVRNPGNRFWNRAYEFDIFCYVCVCAILLNWHLPCSMFKFLIQDPISRNQFIKHQNANHHVYLYTPTQTVTLSGPDLIKLQKCSKLTIHCL